MVLWFCWITKSHTRETSGDREEAHLAGCQPILIGPHGQFVKLQLLCQYFEIGVLFSWDHRSLLVICGFFFNSCFYGGHVVDICFSFGLSSLTPNKMDSLRMLMPLFLFCFQWLNKEHEFQIRLEVLLQAEGDFLQQKRKRIFVQICFFVKSGNSSAVALLFILFIQT